MGFASPSAPSCPRPLAQVEDGDDAGRILGDAAGESEAFLNGGVALLKGDAPFPQRLLALVAAGDVRRNPRQPDDAALRVRLGGADRVIPRRQA